MLENPKRRRVMVENSSSLQSARRHRETFMDRVATKQAQMRWEWPKQIEWVGYCEAVMYASDKWHDPGDFEDYKHVAEAEQKLYAVKGFIRDYHSGKPMALDAQPKRLPPNMPEAFAELANVFGVHMRTFEGDFYEIDIARAKLGAANHPTLGTFLFVYTVSGGVHMLITGKELRVERDGITG